MSVSFPTKSSFPTLSVQCSLPQKSSPVVPRRPIVVRRPADGGNDAAEQRPGWGWGRGLLSLAGGGFLLQLGRQAQSWEAQVRELEGQMAELRRLHDEAVQGREWMKERLHLAEMKAAEFSAVNEEDSRNLLTLQGQNEELRKNVATLENEVHVLKDDNEELMDLYTVALEGRERVTERLFIAEMEAAEYAVVHEEDAGDLIELRAQKESLESRIQLLMNDNEELTGLYTAALEERNIMKDKLHAAEMRVAEHVLASHEASRQLLSSEAHIQQLQYQNEERGREVEGLKKLEKDMMISLYNAKKLSAKYAVEREDTARSLLSAEWQFKQLEFSLTDVLKQLEEKERKLEAFTVKNSQLETALNCAIRKGREKDTSFATQTRQLECSLECALNNLKQKQDECDELRGLLGMAQREAFMSLKVENLEKEIPESQSLNSKTTGPHNKDEVEKYWKGLPVAALQGNEIEMVKVNRRVSPQLLAQGRAKSDRCGAKEPVSWTGPLEFSFTSDVVTENVSHDHVFQVDLPLVLHCMCGYNSGIFSYGKIREDAEEEVCFKYLKEVDVSNTVDFLLQLVQEAADKHINVTNKNHVSSKSHTKFTCNVKSECKSQGRTNHLVELGRSIDDSYSFSPGYLHSFRVPCYFNKALSSFRLVIMNLGSNSNLNNLTVPYGDSKVTLLLEDSSGGTSKLHVVANMRPIISSSEDKHCMMELYDEVLEGRDEGNENIEEGLGKTFQENGSEEGKTPSKILGKVKILRNKFEQLIQSGKLLSEAKTTQRVKVTSFFSNSISGETQAHSVGIENWVSLGLAEQEELELCPETLLEDKNFLDTKSLVRQLPKTDIDNIQKIAVHVVDKLEENRVSPGLVEQKELVLCPETLLEDKKFLDTKNLVCQLPKTDIDNIQKIAVLVVDKLEEILEKHMQSESEDQAKGFLKINGRNTRIMNNVKYQELHKSHLENESLTVELYQSAMSEAKATSSSTSMREKVKTPSKTNEDKPLENESLTVELYQSVMPEAKATSSSTSTLEKVKKPSKTNEDKPRRLAERRMSWVKEPISSSVPRHGSENIKLQARRRSQLTGTTQCKRPWK